MICDKWLKTEPGSNFRIAVVEEEKQRKERYVFKNEEESYLNMKKYLILHIVCFNKAYDTLIL
jgi:hypothetical protein